MAENDQNQGPFTEQQLDGIKSLVSNIVNSAISARDKMADKKRAEDRDAVKNEFAKLLDEKLSAHRPATDDDKDGKKGRRSKEEDVELTALRKSLEDLRQQNEATMQRAQRERAKNIDGAVRNAIFEALSEHGLDTQRAKAAYAAFKLDERIESQVDDESDAVSVLFRDDDGQQVPLKDGVKRWVKTDAAKIYLPPTGAKGSGSRPANSSGQKGALSEADIRQNLGEALKNALT